MFEDLIVPAGGSLPATTSPSASPAASGGNVESFVQTYLPLAQKVSEKTGVAPESLLGQWGLETGWGKSVIPGTNNLGNIKDVTRKGPVAVDNMTKSSDSYMAFETPDQFGDHFAGLLSRRYKTALGAGDDSQKFFTELKRSGYAEDPGYIQKGVSAANMVAKVLGGEGRQMTTIRDPQAAAPAPGGEYFTPQRGTYADLIVPPEPRSFGQAAADTALGAASGVVQGVGLLANVAGADNPVSRGANELSQGLMGMQSPQRQEERAARADTIRAAEATGSTWEEIKANVGGFLEAPIETTLNALGTSAPTILTAFIPGLGQAGAARLIMQGALGAAQGAGAVKGSIYESVERKLVESGMSKDDAAKIAAGAQAYDSENGGNIVAGAILGAAAGTTGIEAMLSKAMGGQAAARGLLARAGMGVVTEAPVEGAQGGQERYAANVALQNQGFDVPTFQGVAGQAAGEAVASAPGGAAFGALTPSAPAIPPALKPVADKAAEPNSPLSRSAIAGAVATAEAVVGQPAQAPVDPMQRLAALEAIGKGTPAQQVVDDNGNPLTIPGEPGRIFTAEEKAEYDQLKALRDATPGMTEDDRKASEPEPVDQIMERVKSIEGLLRTNDGLAKLRQDDAPVNVKQFLDDLAKAKSKSTPAAAREQALNRIEMIAEWMGVDLSAMGAMPQQQVTETAGPPTRAAQVGDMIGSAGLSAQDRTAAVEALATYRNRNLPQATRDAALSRALELVGRNAAPAGTPNDAPAAVFSDIPPQEGTPERFELEAERRENGAYQFRELGFDDEANALLAEADSLREAAASARAGELGVEMSADESADASSSAVQQTVDQATQGLPRAQIPAEDISRPIEERTAARRKRKAQLGQLADLGFETVVKRGDGFVLVNSKTNQEVTLESAADAQLARTAIKEAIDKKANTAAASPLNDRKEPTEAQIKAGNYKKSDVIEMNGVKVVIENPAGSTRRGVGADGKAWESTMVHHYGEIVGTEGADGDRVDVFIGNRPDSNKVFVIDQVNPDGSFDEHKLVFGATSEEDARQTYLANYDKGWTGLGAIKEIPVADLKGWLKTGAKKPAAESGAGTVTVTSNGKTVTLPTVDLENLSKSAARGERGNKVTRDQGMVLKGLATFFGKDVVFFKDPAGQIGDGFVKPGDDVTIYLNEESGIGALSVLGHELTHLLKRDNPAAYDAIKKVVQARVKDAKGFRGDYNGTKPEETADGALNDAELEELVSDLNGNLMRDPAFWKDVFDQIQKDNGKESKGIIASLAAIFQRMLDGAVAMFKGQPQFRADRFVTDMQAIREAFKAGMAQYAAAQGMTKGALQAEVLRANNKLGDIKKSPARPDDGLTIEGYHFSKAPRSLLTTGFFGSGLQGSDREAIMAHPDRRLRERLSFYANKGTGVRPEAGVGGIAHKATLTNIYDSDADMKRLKEGRDRRGFESAVINAGYSGYLARLDGNQPGQVILLGRQTVEPEVLGLRTQIDDAKMVPAAKQRPMNLGDKIAANKSLPAGKMKPEVWGRMLMATMPTEAAQLLDLGVLTGDKDIYKDELVALVRKATPEIKRSAARARDEYAEVKAKYKGAKDWMKAPNGEATKLDERQWIQVRTPSFKAWFGDWEEAFKSGGVWAAKPGTVSTAVDDNGEPLVVYHGTDKGGFMEFEKPSGRGRGDLGIFTTPNKYMASSYVRKGRAKAIEAPDVPTSQSDLEDAGYRFDSYMGRLSSKQAEEQELFSYVDLNGNEVDNFTSLEDAVADAIENFDAGDGEKQSGVYALFVNIRNPYESNFDGALWSGERPEQYQVRDADGEPVYDKDGRAYFDLNEAELLASESEGAEVQPADDHYETTDDVVKDARLQGNDGAIIRDVVDDGGGGGGYNLEPTDVFVALDPAQLKSADFNNGEFSDSTGDIRRSTRRGQDPAIGDKTDVSKLPQGRQIPADVAVGSLESSLELARSKSYRRGRDLKKDIQDRVLAAAKAARVNLSDRTKSTFTFLSGMVVGDARFALTSNQNAVGWYDQKVSRAIGALSTVHPEIESDPRSRLAFLWALATTSNGLKVDKNFELAEKAYREWKATGSMPTKIGIGNAAQAINKGMAAYNDLSKKVGDERLLKFMSTKFQVGQIERMLGMTVGGEWKPTPVRGAAILGPKIGNGFFSNLNGYFDALTMDRWLMRTWGRMTGTLLETSKAEIDKTRDKLATRVGALSDEERKTMSKVIGVSLKKRMTRAELDAAAKASQKASMKKEKRELMMAADATNEFRKAANLHHMTMDGQKEAPTGPAERNWIRAVFQEALGQLNADGTDMTMSDLQALLWYPERRLYDAAKSDEDVADGYEDDEAPDYANAAFNLAIANGADRTRVLAAMDAAEARGTVKGAQLSEKEKAEMLDEFRAPPEQALQLLYEVAPNPDNAELTSAWNELPIKEKARITKLVRDAVLADVSSAVGVKIDKTISAMGGYEGQVNPNLITPYKPKTTSYTDARALAAAIGIAFDQKSVALADPRSSSTVGMVRVTLETQAEKVAPALMKAVADKLGVDGFTARGYNIDILNFEDSTGLSTEQFADKIEEVVGEFDDGLEFAIAYGDVKSELINKDRYESEIEAARPDAGREVLERVRRARDRAREIVAAELRGAAVDVPGRAGSARRDDAGGAAVAARASEALAVQDAGGVRRSPGRVSLEGGQDQGAGREEDGSLSGLPRDFNVAGTEIRASHWAPAEEVARRYMEQAGLQYRPPAKYVKVDPQRAKRIADAYDQLKHEPQNPMVKAAYKALARETAAQYQAVVDSGLKVEFIDFASQGDPYAASPRLMTEDVRENNHMWVFSTRDGFGTDATFDPDDNPLLAETDFIISGKRALVNDLFRVVHDYFGHVKEGVGFRADGEENTWRAHSAMFSPLAQRALTTETRGQNSWVNYGPHGEKNRKASAGETHYADQKTGLLPLWVSEEGRNDVQRSAARKADAAPGAAAEEPARAEAVKSDIQADEAKGRKVSYDVTVEDTGETAKMTVDAGEALADYDDRIDTMKKLLECLNK